MLLDFRQPEIYVLEKVVSFSGRYLIFYGTHFEAGIPCFVFGASSRVTGQIVSRHYNEKQPGSFAPKAECLSAYNQFKEKMLAKPESEESEDSHIPRDWEN